MAKYIGRKFFLLGILFILADLAKAQNASSSFSLTMNPNDIMILLNETQEVYIHPSGTSNTNLNITFQVQHQSICDIIPNSLILDPNTGLSNNSTTIIGRNIGHSEITATITSYYNVDWNNSTVLLRVTVTKSWLIYHISIIIGWIYFIAWSISFYPQIYVNWKRNSVIGLNFDFVTLNLCGFILYSTFNIGLYFIENIKTEYAQRYPKGVNPVMINDVFFSVHAFIATLCTIMQCLIYERGDQRVSYIGRIILSIFGIILLISGILVATNTILWLDFLYNCSYIKLSITLIKYIPQAYMNYKRKSTIGWSIGNIFLDFVGGLFSMLQMILNSYNYDDWRSIFGDPTKFGLGLFSVCFDIFFILQHYVFYRTKKTISKNPLCGSEIEESGGIVENSAIDDIANEIKN